jgi:hypothetical protein
MMGTACRRAHPGAGLPAQEASVQMDVNPASEASKQDYGARPTAPPVVRPEHTEDSFTRLIEQQTAKVPSQVFLFASLCSMAASLGLELARRERAARFVGLWVTPLLVMGVYNKLVKTLGPR